MKGQRRRWLQFSLGSLFIVTTIFAVWLARLTTAVHRQREAVAAIQNAGGHVIYRHQPSEHPPGPAWLRRALGDDYFQTPVMVRLDNASDQLLAQLPNLPELETLEVRGSLSGNGLEHLWDLPRLKGLVIDSPIGNRDLQALAGIRQLEALAVFSPRVSDAGLVHLAPLDRLQDLMLGCAISDAGLRHLLPLMQLQRLECITNTRLSAALQYSTTIDFLDVPLVDGAQYLSDLHEIPVRIDRDTLLAAGIDPDRLPLSTQLTGLSLRDALDRLLRPHGLHWTSRSGTLIITTAQSAHDGRRNLRRLQQQLPKLQVEADW